MSFRVGDTVGEYKIVAPLGRGGMGQVFRVEHTLTKRIEAMKVLVKHPMEGAEPVSRFLREVKIHASLDHPNIVTVHNAFQVGDDLALVMELIEGRSLKESIRERALSPAAAVRSISGALAGLEYAHQRNIIHRDISPSNIILTEAGIPKLMDFGLSKVVAEPALGQSGVVLGTVYYCSPEQVKGSTNLDARSDIYSLGVVLYEALTGRRPFESETAFNIMVDHVDTAPVPPSDVNPAVPRRLNDIVLKAMAKRPADRFQSAGEFREALQQSLAGLDAQSSAQRLFKTPVWQSVAAGCIRVGGRRSVQLALVALGLAIPVTVVCVNVVGQGATPSAPPAVRWPAPAVPSDALLVSSVTPAASSENPSPAPRRNAKPAPVSMKAEAHAVEAPPAPAPLAEPAPVPADPVPAVTVADAPSDASAQADPQRRNGLKHFFGKVFHRKDKATPIADAAAEQAGPSGVPNR